MNKIERLKTIINGGTPDITPAGFWFHYKSTYTVEEMIAAHLELYNHTDMDIVKVMQDYRYPVIGEVKEPSDWYNIRILGTESDEFKKLEAVLKGIITEVGDEVMVFQTMFGPFKTASMIYGDELLMEHSKKDPKAVLAGVQIIADGLEQWAQGYLDAGCDGIYYSAQFSEPQRYSEEEWTSLVKPSDIQILNVAQNAKDKYNILHICGEPQYDFKTCVDRYKDYPFDLANWSVKDNDFSLEKGRELFNMPILGGMNNKGNILNGSDDEIIDEVKTIIDSFGTKGLMIGADCTIQGKNISLDKIKVAVQAAHNYNNK